MLRGPHTTDTRVDAPAGTVSGSALVVCLCAEWCTACRAYRAVFDQVAADHPDLRFLWVDIEDSAALMDQVEVENFPTILIGEGETAHFFGTITPQRDVLQRLIAAHRKGHTSGTVAPEISALLGRLQSVPG